MAIPAASCFRARRRVFFDPADTLQNVAHRIAAKHGIRRVRVFGSVARGEAQTDCDVDFLVDAEAVTSS